MLDQTKPTFVSLDDKRNFVLRKVDVMKGATALLASLGITSFYYFRLYADGKYIHLGDNADYMKFYVENIHKSPPMALDMIDHNYTHYIWPRDRSDILMDAATNHGFGNGISILRYEQNYYECWTFATGIANTEIIQMYINQMTELKKFIKHFNKDYADLIKEAKQHTGQYTQMGFDIGLIPERARFGYLSFLPDVSLTQREHQCLRILSKGYTHKGISNKMDISLKTVEFHLSNIREKTGITDRNKLVQLYWDAVEKDSQRCLSFAQTIAKKQNTLT